MLNNTAICVVTHSKRFEIFKQTLQSIREQTNIPIYVAVNGDYKKDFDESYRKSILQECLKYEKVYLSIYLQFRGLSKIWNDCIINCSADHVIVSNDDIQIEQGFFDEFLHIYNKILKKSLYVLTMLSAHSMLINYT